MQYRAEVVSLEGFVQQIACCYLRHGYWFYVSGLIPAGKDPQAVDQKIIEKYGIAVSESTRVRRKRLGQANLQYLRHGHRFVIMATRGQHQFFKAEQNSIHDIRHCPIRYGGYSISYRRGGRTRAGEPDEKWHAHVEIERRRYLELKAWMLELAAHRSVENLILAFYRLPFEPYAPVRRQLLNLLRAVNHARRKAGFRPVPIEVLPLRRRIVRPFGDELRRPEHCNPAESSCEVSGAAKAEQETSGTNCPPGCGEVERNVLIKCPSKDQLDSSS